MLLRSCALTLTFSVFAAVLPGADCIAESSWKAIQDRLESFAKEERLNNVAKIQHPDGGGYGLIIGRNSNDLRVLTARHILSDEFMNPSPTQGANLSVRLYGGETRWRAIPGRVYLPLPSDRVQDIAVIEVSVPLGPGTGEENYMLFDSWREKIVDANPGVGARVELAATVNDIGYAGGHAHISSTDHERPVSYSGLEGHPGQSGAPIATDRGFVAIYLGSKVQQAVPLLDIRDALIAEFGASFWGLIPVDPRPVSKRLCVRLDGAHGNEVTVSGPFGLVILDEHGCGDTTTGRHSIIGNRIGQACTPESFLVTANIDEPFSITCNVDPTGPWRTSGQGFLALQSVGKFRWQLTLDLPRNRGRIRGLVTGTPPNLYLSDGLFRGRTPVSGPIVIEGGALRIDLSTGSEFFEGVYHR